MKIVFICIFLAMLSLQSIGASSNAGSSAPLTCRGFGHASNAPADATGEQPQEPDQKLYGPAWINLMNSAQNLFAQRGSGNGDSHPPAPFQIQWQIADGSGSNGTPSGSPAEICPDLQTPSTLYTDRACYCLTKSSSRPAIPAALLALGGPPAPPQPTVAQTPQAAVAPKTSPPTPTITNSYVKQFRRRFLDNPNSFMGTPEYQAVLQSSAWQSVSKHRSDYSRRNGKVDCTRCH